MATSAQYSVAPTVEISQISTANTARDGSGSTVAVATGPSSAQGTGVGKRIAAVVVVATGNTTAGMVRFFLSVDGGTTKRMITEVPVAAISVGATAPAWQATVPQLVDLVLQGQVSSTSCILYASTHNAETFNVHVFASTY
jgi:hypothetical protein